MTETPSAPFPPPADPPPPPPPRAPRSPLSGPDRLVRDPDDAVVAGVCAAVGRYTDTDPVLWRVTIAVLTLFGGAGVVLYALGWLLLPRRGEAQSVLERLVRRPDRSVGPGGVLLVIAAGVVLLAVLDDGPGFGVLLVIAGLAYLVVRERRDPTPSASTAPYGPGGPYAPPGAGVPYASTGTDVPFGTAAGGPAPGLVPDWPEAPAYGDPVPWSAPAPVPPRRRSRLGPLTLSAAALLTGLLLVLRLTGVDEVTPSRVVAAALLVVGAGLLVGTWVGRARWLLAVGVVLALLLAATAAGERTDLSDGVGQRSWTPTGTESYRLGAGESVLDLRELPESRPVSVSARVGLGELTVLVPDDMRVRVVAQVGVGEVTQVDRDGDRTDHGGGDDTDLREEFVVGDPADRLGARLDLEVGMGQLEVRRVAA